MKAINSKRRLLDVGIITKNEAQNLEKCLQCLRPLQEALDCKILVADTGSTDNSIEIAQQYADEVFSIEWTDDFAEARNKVLDRSNAQWFLTVDTDEFLQDASELIDFFQSGEYKNYKSAFVVQDNAVYCKGYPNDERIEGQEVPRLFYTVDGNKYKGAIHEYVDTIPPTARLRNTKLLHYGYYYTDSPEDKEKHNKRNERNSAIMEKLLEKTPDDLRLLTLAIDSARDNVERCKWAEHIFKLSETQKNFWEGDFAAPSMLRAIKSFALVEKYDKGIEVAKRLEEHLPRAILLCDMWYMVCAIHVAKNVEYSVLNNDFWKYVKYCQHTIADGGKSSEWVFTAPTECDNISIMKIAGKLCEKLCDEITEDTTVEEKESFQKNLDAIINQLDFQNLIVENYQIWIALAFKLENKHLDASQIFRSCFAEYRDELQFDELLKLFWKNVFYRQPDYVVEKINKLELQENWLSKCCKLLLGSNKDEFEEIVLEQENWAAEEQNRMLYAISIRNNWHLPDAAFAIHPPLMGNAIESALSRTMEELDNIDRAYSYLTTNDFTDTLGKNRWAIFLLRSLFQSKYLSKLKQDNRMMELCELYINLTQEYWKHMISVDNMTEEELMAAPAEFVADYYFVKAIKAMENENWVEAMKKIKAVLEQGIVLKNIAVTLSDYIAEKVENQQEEQIQVSDEMQQLAEQMKVQIKNLVAWGETEQAKKALQQLITFCPNDEEAKSLLWVLGAE